MSIFLSLNIRLLQLVFGNNGLGHFLPAVLLSWQVVLKGSCLSSPTSENRFVKTIQFHPIS